MNAVGIDVSKGKSMVSIARPFGEIVAKPFNVPHTSTGMQDLLSRLATLQGDTRIIMEHTGRYYEPVAEKLSSAGFFVCAVNPKLICDYGNNTLRKVKTDKADSLKIARYGLDNWQDLRQHTGMDKKREQLKLMNRQFDFYMKQKTAAKNNLIALVDQTYPGANALFTSPARPDGSQKWVDFVASFWHADCVRKIGAKAFSERYHKWCLRNSYYFQPDKPEKILAASKELLPTLPKDAMTKLLVQQAVKQLNTISALVEQLRAEMNRLASELPEYPIVLAMGGVGPSLGPQIMAEIGDVTRFAHRGSLTAFAGVDPGVSQSGTFEAKSRHASKRGSAQLRKALFQVMSILLKTAPQDDPVFLFMDKKRAEGKQYYVYMTAGMNKFLRIYYGRVKEYLASQAKPE